jgi:hypothetical protein
MKWPVILEAIGLKRFGFVAAEDWVKYSGGAHFRRKRNVLSHYA